MSNVLSDLLDLLALERLEENLFRGQSQDLGWGTVFGGQVLGQALSAAEQTVPQERIAHSLHAYFLRPGDASKPIIYDVDCIRDGKSFTTRRIVAIQKGRPIFNMSASFQRVEEGMAHQAVMPEVPPPDELVSELTVARKFAEMIPETYRERATADRPIEVRPVKLSDPLKPRKDEARQSRMVPGHRRAARQSAVASISVGIRVGPLPAGMLAQAACRLLAVAQAADGFTRSRDVLPSLVSPRRLAALHHGLALGEQRAWAFTRAVFYARRHPRRLDRARRPHPTA